MNPSSKGSARSGDAENETVHTADTSDTRNEGNTAEITSDADAAQLDLVDLDMVRPGAHLVATVWGEAPAVPLDILAPFVKAEVRHGLVIDWRLASGLSAPIDPEIVELFDEWRSRWIRSCTLESLTNLRRLHQLASDSRPSSLGTVWIESVGRILEDGAAGWVSLDDLRVLTSDCHALGDMVRQRGAAALGAVDTTPGRTRTGLADAWALPSERQVIASDAHMSVSIDPDGDLIATCLTRSDPEVRASAPHDPDVRTSSNQDTDEDTDKGTDEAAGTPDPEDHQRNGEIRISRVEITQRTVEIDAVDDHWSVPTAEARPLTWIVPGATSWNVREIPEVIVWAKTFAELPDCCEEARALNRPVQLSIDAPIRAVSAAPPRT